MAEALNAVSARLGNQRGCGCCCCDGSQNNAGGVGCNVVYAVAVGGTNFGYKHVAELVSCHHSLSSQAEADAVDVIVFLGGGDKMSPAYLYGKFTLDGFAMPAMPSVDYEAVNSYPCTFLRKQDRSGWICLAREDVMWPDGDRIDVIVDAVSACNWEDNLDTQGTMCCGLFEHNCRGKMFTAQIIDAEAWTEEQKKHNAYFSLKKETVFYDNFPGFPAYEAEYSDLLVYKDYVTYNATWGDLIEKFGNKPFGVRIQENNNLNGTAFALN